MARKTDRVAALEPRKSPRQSRAVVTREAILEAAAHILVQEGGSACSTNRIADRAGVSIGSLYQYYPNKYAVLRELQQREMNTTLERIKAVLTRRYPDPRHQFRVAVRVFFMSESEESTLRNALGRIDMKEDPDSPESDVRMRAVNVIAHALATDFGLSAKDSMRWAEVILVTVSSVAESVTARERRPRVIRQWADVLSNMLLGQIIERSRPPG